MNWVFLKHKKIRLIKDLDSLNNSQYIEFANGVFDNRYWQENSVFIEDDVFSLVEKAFNENNSEHTKNEVTQITLENWNSISGNLENLKIELIKAKSISEMEPILIYVSDEIKKSFAENFDETKNETVKLVDDLSEWIKSNLEKHKIVSIIGV